ncbi:hypothetical protein ACVXHA_17930 [Escherichia coli]
MGMQLRIEVMGRIMVIECGHHVAGQYCFRLPSSVMRALTSFTSAITTATAR